MGLINGLHNVPVRIELGQSSLAPPPFSNNNDNSYKGNYILLSLEVQSYAYSQDCLEKARAKQ